MLRLKRVFFFLPIGVLRVKAYLTLNIMGGPAAIIEAHEWPLLRALGPQWVRRWRPMGQPAIIACSPERSPARFNKIYFGE